MKVIEASYEILTPISDGGIQDLMNIERIGRVCYKSEEKIKSNGESAKNFVTNLIKRGHEAMLEHSTLSVIFTCDRGVSHELVRHRIASFAQESQRYVNYSRKEDGVIFIRPITYPVDSEAYNDWLTACGCAETWYMQAIERGATPQEARTVLPNSTKTEIVVTANYREWRNIFKLRTAKAAHPAMRALMIPLLEEIKEKLPIIFDDIIVEDESK